MLKQFIFLALVLTATFAQFKDCKGTQNDEYIINEKPALLDSVANGKKFLVNDTQNDYNLIYIASLKGTPKEIGKAFGELFKKEIKENLDGMFTYLQDLIRSSLKQILPSSEKWVADILPIGDLIDFILVQKWIDTDRFTPKRFKEEIEGIAEGSGLHKNFITFMNLLPEIVKVQCSLIGSWGPSNPEGDLLQVRALDWFPLAPINKYPLITVYHFDDEDSQPFVNIGWAGIIGSLAGMSPKVAIGQKLWWPDVKNETSPFGIPATYIARDILQFDTNLSQAIKRLGEAHRTCKMFWSVGSLDDNKMLGVKYAATVFEVYDDKNFSTPYPDAHPLMDGILFWDKWAQPSKHACLGETLKGGYGEIDPEYLFRISTAMGETGDTMISVYDFSTMSIHVAYSQYKTGKTAYTRPFFYFKIEDLLDLDK